MRGELLKTGHPVAEPDTEMNIGIGAEDYWIDRTHPGNRGIAKQDGIVPAIDRCGNISGRLASIDARAIMAPVGRIGSRIDECKFELPIPLYGAPFLLTFPA